LNTFLGSGILAFPAVLAADGWVMFTAAILVFMCASFGSAALVLEIGQRKGVLNLSGLTTLFLGSTATFILQLCVVLVSQGALMSYLNVIGVMGSDVLTKWGWGWTYAEVLVVAAVLITPLICFRSYGDLTPISLVSLCCIVFIVFFVLLEGLNVTDGDLYVAQPWPESTLAALGTLGTYGSVFSTYAVFEAYLSTTLEDKPKFIYFTWALAVGCAYSLICLMAVFGYGAFGSDVDSDILSSFSTGNPAVQVAQLVVVLHLVFYIPNDFVLMRLYTCELSGIKVLDLSTATFLALTLALWAFPVIVMALVPQSDVDGVFGYLIDLTGDVPSALSCLIIPGLLFVYASPEENGSLKYLGACAMVALGAFLVVICTVVDTYNFLAACLSSDGCDSYS